MSNRSGDRPSMAAAALVVVVGLVGCGGTGGMGGTRSATPMMSQDPSAAAYPAMPHMSPNPKRQVDGADVMFVRMMLPHHEQAVTMSTTLLTKSGVSTETVSLAQQIRAAQEPEITVMQGWLDAWRQPRMGGVSAAGMHGHDGMASDAELKAFSEADGAAAEKLYLTLMTAHHSGALTMADTEVRNGQDPDVLQLARNVAVSQRTEINTMKKLLGRL